MINVVVKPMGSGSVPVTTSTLEPVDIACAEAFPDGISDRAVAKAKTA